MTYLTGSTRQLALVACAVTMAACSHSSPGTVGDIGASDEHGLQVSYSPVVNDSFPKKAGLIVSLARAADVDQAIPTTVRLTSPDMFEAHQQVMTLKQVGRPPFNGAFFPGPVDVYGSWFTVDPGAYLVTVERTGYLSRSIPVKLRQGFIENVSLTLDPVQRR